MTASRAAAASSAPQLLRALGPVQGTMIVVGTVIGSGIFVKPGLIAEQVPHFSGIAAVWIVSGLLTLAGALAYAELGAMMPRAGGPYVYLREAFGPFWAFMFGWTEFLINRPASIAALSAISATFFGSLVKLDESGKFVYAFVAIALLTAVNYFGVKSGSAVQTVFTLAKVGALAFIVAGALVLGQGTSANFSPLTPARFDADSLKLFGAAMIGALWAYDGWANATSIAEELRDPQRNVPLCMIAGTLFIIGTYLAANLAYHYVLPMGVVQHCQPDRFAGARGVAAEAGLQLVGELGLTLVALGVMCSTFGAANGVVLTGARITFAMSRDRMFFPQVAAVHPRYRTPHVSIVVQGLLALAYIVVARLLHQPVFDLLTDCIIVVSWVFYALAVASVFVLRKKLPHLARPYTCFGYPLVPALFIAMAIGFVGNAFVAAPLSSLIGLGITALGVPAYYRFRAQEAQG